MCQYCTRREAGQGPEAKLSPQEQLLEELVSRFDHAHDETALNRATSKARGYARLPQSAREQVAAAQARAYTRLYGRPGPKRPRHSKTTRKAVA